MKKVINVGIGGRSFTMDEDAYSKLKKYLHQFRTQTKMGIQTKEVMDDLEERIAELFGEQINSFRDVISVGIVNNVIAQLGMPDGEPFNEASEGNPFNTAKESFQDFVSGINPVKKLFRDPDQKVFGGVCSGLAHYLNLDILLVRLLFAIAFFLGSAGFWIYIIFWIAVPLANSPAKKCEMYGLPITAENLRRFSNNC